MDGTIKVTDSRGFCERALHPAASGVAAVTFRTAMLPLSWAYALATRLRRYAYQSGLLSSYSLNAAVISVGNITAGGTGKTPCVEWIARWLKENGRSPAVVSRGYGATETDTDSVGKKNDEQMVLEQNLPGVPHFADADRVRAGREALAQGADCLVLDDGFQHLRLRRNVNLVLINALDPFGGERHLPGGLLREPLSALRDADIIIITHADAIAAADLARLRQRLAKLGGDCPIVEAAYRPTALLAPDETEEPPETLTGRRILLFCGIGNPEGFVATVKRLGADVVEAHFFPDHFHYGGKEIARLMRACERSGAEIALTTQKDMVKIGAWKGKTPLRALRIQMEFTSRRETLVNLLQSELS